MNQQLFLSRSTRDAKGQALPHTGPGRNGAKSGCRGAVSPQMFYLSHIMPWAAEVLVGLGCRFTALGSR